MLSFYLRKIYVKLSGTNQIIFEMILSKLAFRVNDFFRGKIINFHYKKIRQHFKNKGTSEKELFQLIAFSKKNVPFYKKFLFSELEQFPILSKSSIRASLASFKSQDYLGKRVMTMTTSGSTGTPFTVYQNSNKKARNYADTLYFGEMAGYELGNKLYYLKIWAKQKMSNPLIYRIQNIVPVDVIELNDERIHFLLREMESSKEKINILGYVSALENFIRYAEKRKIHKFNVKVISIITMSEGLSNETRQKLQSLFDCKVVSRYSNLENGIIAQQEFNSDMFLVNTASYYLEIVHPTSENILPDGELGRIIVTDLYNYSMPMIRYDTGDFGIRIQQGGKTYLQTVEGRKLDLLYNTEGNLVSSYVMYKNMWQYTEIEQYQLVQTGLKSYEFRINCPSGFKMEEQLVSEFKQYLGQDAIFKVVYINEIPLLDSGKRRKTVNLYYK